MTERAKEGESLDDLRARTAAQFNEHSGFQGASSKKRKAFSMLDEENMKFGRFD